MDRVHSHIQGVSISRAEQHLVVFHRPQRIRLDLREQDHHAQAVSGRVLAARELEQDARRSRGHRRALASLVSQAKVSTTEAIRQLQDLVDRRRRKKGEKVKDEPGGQGQVSTKLSESENSRLVSALHSLSDRQVNLHGQYWF